MIRTLGIESCRAVSELWRTERSSSVFLGDSWTQKSIEEVVSLGDSLGFFCENQLRAFILGRRKAVWEIELLATSPVFRRQGIMRSLLLEWRGNLPPGCEIWVDVHLDNVGAHQFYESLGFTRVGQRKSYYSDGKDALLYSYFRDGKD